MGRLCLSSAGAIAGVVSAADDRFCGTIEEGVLCVVSAVLSLGCKAGDDDKAGTVTRRFQRKV